MYTPFVDICLLGFPGGISGKEPACQCRRHRRRGFNLWVRKIPWRKKWQPAPVFLPGESHGLRDRGAWQATANRITKSQTQLKWLSTSTVHICISLMWVQRTDSLEQTLMLEKIEGGRRRGQQRMRWLDGITDSWTGVWVNARSWWWTGRPGVLQSLGSQRFRHDWATELNWAFPFSRGSSQPRDWTQVSHIAGVFFTSWATREAQTGKE